MKKTLVVIGAGASKAFCPVFPTGPELFKEINYHFLTERKYPSVGKSKGRFLSAMMNEIDRVFPEFNDRLLVQVKNQIWKLQLHYEHTVMHKRNVMAPPSVDWFISNALESDLLDDRASNLLKYSISYLIKGAEEAAAARLRKEDEDNWLNHLVRGLDNLNVSRVNSQVRFVTFNYNRTLEHAFGMYSEGPEFDLNRIVTHPYGSLGTLDEFPFKLGNDKTEYMKAAYRGVHLIGEERAKVSFDHDDFEQVHFLGFGFDRNNMMLLGLPEEVSIRGTGHGFDDQQIERLYVDYSVIIEEDLSCTQYVDSVLLPSLIS